MDSLHDRLLGLDVGPYGVLSPLTGSGKPAPLATPAPTLLLGGRLAVKRARLVDAFGRTLDLPDRRHRLSRARRSRRRAECAQAPPAQARPLAVPARRPRRSDGGFARGERSTRSSRPRRSTRSPVSCCPTTSTRRSSSSTAPASRSASCCTIRSAAEWPGRSRRAATGRPTRAPATELEPAQKLLGRWRRRSSPRTRRPAPARSQAPEEESALSALLRAIDTTLWTVDTFAVARIDPTSPGWSAGRSRSSGPRLRLDAPTTTSTRCRS